MQASMYVSVCTGAMTILGAMGGSNSERQVIQSSAFQQRSHSVRATYYQAVARQCDANPRETADGSHIRNVRHAEVHHWVALSRDLARRYPFGSRVYLTGLGELSGEYTVHDLMNRRYHNRIDILVGTALHPQIERWTSVRIRLVARPPQRRLLPVPPKTSQIQQHVLQSRRRPPLPR
jgi:3D (Asp-Asp-Asp) domain-containing protein